MRQLSKKKKAKKRSAVTVELDKTVDPPAKKKKKAMGHPYPINKYQ